MKKSKVIFLALLACAFGASARTVTPEEARHTARAWVARGKTLGVKFPSYASDDAVAHATTNGVTFYTVKMKNGGTVFLSSDTKYQPVLGFTGATDDFTTIDPKSPLWALLNGDVSRMKSKDPRLAFATASAQSAPQTANEKKWAALIEEGQSLPAFRLGTSAAAIHDVGGIEDLRVPALVKSQWSQSEAQGQACYNFYTPPGPNGSANNAVCGCVATAMSQVMRYFQYPSEAVTPVTHTCSYNEKEISLTMQGGTYDWANMTLVPARGALSTQNCMAIGKLTSDAGIAVWMMYGDDGSGAYTPEAGTVMQSVFGYKNTVCFDDANELLAKGSEARVEALQRTMFVNFDAGLPVLVSIPGHAVVADGYGYVEETDYVHFNMGWAGSYDYWYNIPDLTEAGFDAVNSITYNIFTNAASTCAVMSGRVIDDDALPMADVDIAVYNAAGEIVHQTKTGGNGIWSAILPAGTYDVVARSGRLMGEIPDIELTTPAAGLTLYVNCRVNMVEPETPAALGNSWGNDLELSEPTVRIIVDEATTNFYTTLDKALRTATNGNETVEILLPTTVKKPVTVWTNCTVVATNEDAAASAITCLNGARITVASNAVLSVSNVAFDVADDAKTIVVQDGGVLAVGGYVDLMAVETAAYSNLVVAAELTYPFAVDCLKAATNGTTFAAASTDFATAKACANLLLNYRSTRLGGEAYEDAGGVKFRWSKDAPVPIQKTVAQLDVGAGRVNYRSVNDLFEDYDGKTDAEIIVLKSQPFTGRLAGLKQKVAIYGEGAERPTLTVKTTADDVRFEILEGGALTISNLAFCGIADERHGSDYGFIKVNGGELTLDDGAELNNIAGHITGGSGVIDLMAGKATMRPGAAILNCTAAGGNDAGGCGGGIYVKGVGCDLRLEGGRIANCYAQEYGGGIYAEGSDDDAAIRLSGLLTISGNASGWSASDNIFMLKESAVPTFKLVGKLDGKVGVSYPGYCAGNDEGDAFISYAETMTPEDVEISALAFFNDDDDNLGAAVDAANRRLIWAKKIDDDVCDEADATAHVQYEGESAVHHYANIATAFAYLRANAKATVRMYKAGQSGEELLSYLAVPEGADVVLTSGEGQPYGLRRYQGAGITVPGGSSLTLTNIVLCRETSVESGEITNALINVEGGSLTLAAGACVSNILGNTSRDANAITVWKGGTFTMLPGAEILKCWNYYNADMLKPTTYAQSYGVGGGVLVDNATAYLRGGRVWNCAATRGGGVYACNEAKVYVSGGVRITGNYRILHGGAVDGASNLLVEDLAELYVDGEVTDNVGTGDFISWLRDTNLVAKVSADWAWSAEALTNSAARFSHDRIDGVRGVAVTNGNEAIIVWSSALADGGYTDADGNEYVALVAGPSDDPNPESEPELLYTVTTNKPAAIAFTAVASDAATWKVTLADLVAGAKYALYKTNSLAGGFAIEGVRPFTNFTAEADGPLELELPADDLPPVFWRATGEETYKTNYFSK